MNWHKVRTKELVFSILTPYQGQNKSCRRKKSIEKESLGMNTLRVIEFANVSVSKLICTANSIYVRVQLSCLIFRLQGK